jgi:hypothetical protein
MDIPPFLADELGRTPVHIKKLETYFAQFMFLDFRTVCPACTYGASQSDLQEAAVLQ